MRAIALLLLVQASVAFQPARLGARRGPLGRGPPGRGPRPLAAVLRTRGSQEAGEAGAAAAGPPRAQAQARTRARAPVLSREKLDLYLNGGVIAALAVLVLGKVVTVDMDLWRGWTWGEVLLRVPADNWNGYMSVLHDAPVLVKACTSLAVYVLGDIASQLLTGTELEELDRARIARSGAAGFIGHGPLSHFWYILCDGTFERLGLTAWWSVFPKVGVDQLLWGPCWNSFYVVLLGLMKRDDLREILQTARATYWPLIAAGVKLWVPVHMVTYGLIPQENRLLWVDAVEIIWCCILATTAAEAAAAGEGAEEEA